MSGRGGFAEQRGHAEAEVSGGQYTLDEIYQRLVTHHGVGADKAERLKQLELDAERRHLFPIAEHCAEVGPDDVIVSDMYLPFDFVSMIVRDICGLRTQKLFLSANGKRFGTVWPIIRQERRLREHLGDNPVTDIASAQNAGIPARLTTIHRRTPIEEELAGGGFEPLAHLVRQARLATWHEDVVTRRTQLGQIQLNFPLLFLATLHLRKLAAARGWERVLMSARDCYLWCGLYEKLRERLPDLAPATYFYTSRNARSFPSAAYLAYFARLRSGNRNVVVDLTGTGWSLSHLIERAPTPATEIFLVHHVDNSDWLEMRQRYARLNAPIDVQSLVCRTPLEWELVSLENLNFAPHPSVEDVRETPAGFQPVYSSLTYDAALADLIAARVEAFAQATALLPTIDDHALADMAGRDVVAMFHSIYRHFREERDEFAEFSNYTGQEERLVWNKLEGAVREPA